MATGLAAWSFRERVMLIVVGLVVILYLAQSWLAARAQKDAARIALAVDTLVASRDSSRSVALSRRDSLKILGDTLSAVQRRSVQVEQRGDDLDKSLRLERIAKAELRTQLVQLRASGSSVVHVDTVVTQGSDTTTIRRAHFDVDQPPYSGVLDVSLPAVGRASYTLTISPAPATLALRIGCGDPVDGIRPATAVATGPAWLSLQLGRVEQSPDLCRSPALSSGDRRSLLRRLVDRVGVEVGYGATLANGSVHVGPSIQAGVKIWP
jgi:hypothetical protein